MPAPITLVSAQAPLVSVGNVRGALVILTFDASYTAGGESLSPAEVGLQDIYHVDLSVDGVGDDVTVDAQYDYTANTVILTVEDATTGISAEASGANVDGVIVRAFVIGA